MNRLVFTSLCFFKFNLYRYTMSHNCVSSLAPLAQFRQLRLLSAGDNPVDDIPQLDFLARGCPHLEALSLAGGWTS